MVDATQFPYQLTPVDYDPFSEAYAYSQKLAKQQQDNALMTHAVGGPAQGPTVAEMSRDPSVPLGVRFAARATEAGPLGWPGALAGAIDKFHQVATGQSYLEPGKAPLTKQEVEDLGIGTGFNVSLGGVLGPMPKPGKLKMGYSGHDDWNKDWEPDFHDLEKVNPDVMLENHPMKGAINDFAADPFEQTKVMPNSETEKQLHGFLEDFSLNKENDPKLGDKELAIPYQNQNMHDYLLGKISFNKFSEKATQSDSDHLYVNAKLWKEMQFDKAAAGTTNSPANKAHTPADIIAAKEPKTAAKEPSLHSDEFWNKDWEPGVRPEPAGQPPNWTYIKPESLADRYSRPAVEPPQSQGKKPYYTDFDTGEVHGPDKYKEHLTPVKWSELKGKSEQNLLTPDMPTYGPAVEQGYNPNLLLHRGTSGKISGEAWWDPATKPRERGVFAADEPRVSKAYGENQYPAVGAFDKPMEIDWRKATGEDHYSSQHMPGMIDAAREAGADLLIVRGIKDIVNSGKAAHDQYVVLDPGKLRDPQLAKFDPARKGENNLLAGIGGGMVSLPVLKSLLAPTDEGTKK